MALDWGLRIAQGCLALHYNLIMLNAAMDGEKQGQTDLLMQWVGKPQGWDGIVWAFQSY